MQRVTNPRWLQACSIQTLEGKINYAQSQGYVLIDKKKNQAVLIKKKQFNWGLFILLGFFTALVFCIFYLFYYFFMKSDIELIITTTPKRNKA